MVVYVVLSLKYANCVITISSLHKFTFIQHLTIFLQICLIGEPSSTGRQLSYTV